MRTWPIRWWEKEVYGEQNVQVTYFFPNIETLSLGGVESWANHLTFDSKLGRREFSNHSCFQKIEAVSNVFVVIYGKCNSPSEGKQICGEHILHWPPWIFKGEANLVSVYEKIYLLLRVSGRVCRTKWSRGLFIPEERSIFKGTWGNPQEAHPTLILRNSSMENECLDYFCFQMTEDWSNLGMVIKGMWHVCDD